MASRRLVLKALLGIAIILAMSILGFIAYIAVERHNIERRLVHLLCETDHQALLEACRDVSRRAARGEYEAGRAYAIRRHPGRYSFPQAILDVDPLFVIIGGDGLVWVEMFWLPSHGVVAYPDDYQGTRHVGNIELIPGLRYYDEDYHSDNPKRMKFIDGILARCEKRRQGYSGGGCAGSSI